MKYYSDIELINAKILNAVVESLDIDPTFSSSEKGRIYFNNATNTLRLNNGVEYHDVSIPANFNNLIDTLGANWISTNYTFDPTAFNALSNVNGLTENDSLYSVISQLDTAIHQLSNSSLTNLSDVVETQALNAGNVVYYTGDFFSFASLDSIIENYSTLKYTNLKDVDSSNIQQNSLFFYDNVSEKFKAASLIYENEDLQVSTSHSISHNLGVKYCSVTLINRLNDTLITNATVTFTDINLVDITLPTAAPIHYILVANPSLS